MVTLKFSIKDYFWMLDSVKYDITQTLYRLNDNSNQRTKSLGIIKDTFTGYFCARTIYHLWLAGYQRKLKVCIAGLATLLMVIR